MINPNTKPEAVPAPIHLDTAVAPAAGTNAKAGLSGSEHKGTNTELPKS
jgi:hypothetical protein